MSEQGKPLTDAEIEAAAAFATAGDGVVLSGAYRRFVPRLIRDLRVARSDLAAETATRTALRTQEARVSGLLADAATVPTDPIGGVTALIDERAVLVRMVGEIRGERDEMRAARDDASAVRDRLKDTNAALRADLVRVEGQRDEMREARDRIAAEADRLRAELDEGAAVVARLWSLTETGK